MKLKKKSCLGVLCINQFHATGISLCPMFLGGYIKKPVTWNLLMLARFGTNGQITWNLVDVTFIACWFCKYICHDLEPEISNDVQYLSLWQQSNELEIVTDCIQSVLFCRNRIFSYIRSWQAMYRIPIFDGHFPCKDCSQFLSTSNLSYLLFRI